MIVKDELLSDWCTRALRVEEAVGGAVLGLGAAIRLVNIAIFARGHVLLEGDVGVGKIAMLTRRCVQPDRGHRRSHAVRSAVLHVHRRGWPPARGPRAT